jgi:phosphodiesterase/alkaline phosphatase D-like protein
VFGEYMPTYPLEAPAGSRGLWQRFSYAYVDVFVVDTRTQRTADGAADNANKSMLDGNRLGLAGQEQWLEDGLAGSTKIWKVILMPTPFNPTVIKRSSAPIWQQDSWTGYLNARAKLLHAVRGVKNVLMLSGDLHAGAIDDGTNSGVIEMVTPAPNFTGTSPEKCLTADVFGIWSHGTYSKKKPPRVCNGYGVVRLTPTQATLQVKDEDGKVKLQLIVPAR